MGSDTSDMCFECLGEAAWCPICSKTSLLPVVNKEEEPLAEEMKKESDDPNQFPLL